MGNISIKGATGADGLVQENQNSLLPVRLANATPRELSLLRNKNLGSFHSAVEDGEMGPCYRLGSK